MGSQSRTQQWRISFDRPDQIKAGLVALAFFAVFWPLLDINPAGGLGDLVHRWLHDLDWSHGWIIPVFSAYLVYQRWDVIRRQPVRHTWVGLLIMVGALLLYQWTLWGLHIHYIKLVSMLLCVLGIVIFLCGLPVMRYAWLPWLYLFFALPLPKRAYFAMTDPLRRLAATVASTVLDLDPSLDIQRLGSKMIYTYKGTYGELDVADACSGMRSTVTLCALGVAVAFVSDRPWWQRLIMIASCVPIATFCNFIRVTITSVLHIYVDPEYAQGIYHTVLGLLMMALALAIFWGLGWVLSNLVVEVDEDEDDEQSKTSDASPA